MEETNIKIEIQLDKVAHEEKKLQEEEKKLQQEKEIEQGHERHLE